MTTVDAFVHHRGPVTSLAAVPTARALMVGGYDGAVSRFDLDHESFELFGYHDHLINSITVDGQGRRAATCSSDYSIGIWDLADGRLSRRLLGHGDDVEKFAFVDDVTGVSASRDHTLNLWDLESGAVLRVLRGHTGDVVSVDVAEDLVISTGEDGTVRFWDLASGALLDTFAFEADVDCAAVDPAGRRVVVGCDDGRIRAYSLDTRELIAEAPAHTISIKSVRVAGTSGRVVSAGYDNRLRLWTRDLEEILELQPGNGAWERSVCWAPDEQRVYAGTFDGTVVGWDTGSGELATMGHSEGNPCHNKLAVAGERIAVASDDGIVRGMEVGSDGLSVVASTQPLPHERRLMNAIAMTGDGRHVVVGRHDHAVQAWRWDDLGFEELWTTNLGGGPVNALSLPQRAELPWMLAGSFDGSISVLDELGERCARWPLHRNAVKGIALHPERPVAASISADGNVLVWNVFGGQAEMHIWAHLNVGNDVAFSPTGALLASVGRDFTTRVFDTSTGAQVAMVFLGKRSLKSVDWVDEDSLVTGDYWGTVTVFGLDGEISARRQVAQNGISLVRVEAGSIVVSSWDGSVAVLSPSLEVLASNRLMQQRVLSV